jgi:hypothetical protein
MVALLPGVQMQVPRYTATWAMNPLRPTAPARSGKAQRPRKETSSAGVNLKMHEHKTLTIH